MMFAEKIVIGTRRSKLARVQSEYVAGLLKQTLPRLEVVLREILTEGDRTQQAGIALPSIGGKGLFTQELEAAILAGEADLAVHSLKDLPTEVNPKLCIGAYPVRGPVADILISRNRLPFSRLAPGAKVGTSSLRRETQLMGLRADLRYMPIRGNVDTRIAKVEAGEFDACVLAESGVVRLGLQSSVSEVFDVENIYPAPGQGALAIQCGRDREDLLALLSKLDHLPTRFAVLAERAFLSELQAGCSTPLAAYAVIKNSELLISVRAVSKDGRKKIELRDEVAMSPGFSDNDAAGLGSRIAKAARARGILAL